MKWQILALTSLMTVCVAAPAQAQRRIFLQRGDTHIEVILPSGEHNRRSEYEYYPREHNRRSEYEHRREERPYYRHEHIYYPQQRRVYYPRAIRQRIFFPQRRQPRYRHRVFSPHQRHQRHQRYYRQHSPYYR